MSIPGELPQRKFYRYGFSSRFYEPQTTIGAAHPVTVEGQEVSEKNSQWPAASFIRTLAETRGRNPEIAEKMVEKAFPSPKKKRKKKV